MKNGVREKIGFTIVIVFVMALAAGCFGGSSGGSSSSDPSEDGTRISGQVKAPSDNISGASLSLMAASIAETPVAGAQVRAQRLDGTTIGTTGQTDQNGNYVLTGISEGERVIIVALKSVGNKSIRLSSYVQRVGEQTSANVSSATSIATEALAARVFSSRPATSEEWQRAIDTAEEVIEDLEAAGLLDFTVGGPIIGVDMGDFQNDAADFDPAPQSFFFPMAVGNRWRWETVGGEVGEYTITGKVDTVDGGEAYNFIIQASGDDDASGELVAAGGIQVGFTGNKFIHYASYNPVEQEWEQLPDQPYTLLEVPFSAGDTVKWMGQACQSSSSGSISVPAGTFSDSIVVECPNEKHWFVPYIGYIQIQETDENSGTTTTYQLTEYEIN